MSNINESQLFRPPLDSRGFPILSACIEMAKRCIFKLAAVFERVSLFTNGEVRARSATLEVFSPELKDSTEFEINKNPFQDKKTYKT